VSWVLGIDPGKDGALVALEASGDLVGAWRAGGPSGYLKAAGVESGYLQALGLAREAAGCPPALVVLEAMGVRAGQSVGAQCTAAYGIGAIAGILTALGWSWQESRPQAWRRALGIQWVRESPKVPVLQWVERRLPQLDLRPGRCVRPHDGLADAGAIACYALKIYKGGAA